MSKDVMQQALEALEEIYAFNSDSDQTEIWERARAAIAALKEAIKQAGEIEDSLESAYAAGQVNGELTVFDQAGEPVARWNWKQAKLEWLVPYKAEFDMRPMFFSAPTFSNCFCGEPRNLGIVHRKDAPCFHYTAAPSIPAGWHKASNADTPKYGEYVLILTTDADGDPVHDLAHFNGKLGYLGVGGKRIKPVTHWMPLPAVPSE